MEKKVIETINKFKMIEPNEKIIAAVSGGPDSICMLDILRKLSIQENFSLIVCHVNHQIRKEAIDDEIYVKDYCKKHNIKCYVKRIDVIKYANNNKQGTEEAGRNVRYKFFNEVFEKESANKIAIAHNKNDKVETILMNILRGSGINGLKGIEPIRENKYIRPLIEIERNDIETYCEINKLNPRIDKTNFINDCSRNKMRNVILPYIKKEFNHNITNTIDRLSKIIEDENSFINELTVAKFDELIIEQSNDCIVLDLKKFNKEHLVLRKRIILFTVNKLLGSILNVEQVNIIDIIKLCSKNIGNKYLMPNKNIKIGINKGKIFFTKS